MARNHGSSITLISVVDANDLLRETNDVMLTDEFMETLKVEGKEIVAQAAKDIPEEIPHDEVTVLGTPGYLIAKHAEDCYGQQRQRCIFFLCYRKCQPVCHSPRKMPCTDC